MTAAKTASAVGRPLAADLEARRLAHRTRRIAFVVGALQERRDDYARRGSVPRPLDQAIAEFSRRLERERRRLAEVALKSRGEDAALGTTTTQEEDDAP